MKIPCLIFCLLLSSGIACAESASTSRSTELRTQAGSDAPTLTMLSNQTRVEVLQRSGAWVQVKTSTGQTGWVHMSSLRLDATASNTATPSSGGNLLGSLTSSGRTSNTGTVGAGVKGLDKEDLRRASPNYAEYQKMQRNSVDKNNAQTFAQRSNLATKNVAYLGEGN
ncbi:SH3 domain-containing protein [Undibacterium sp. TJN19]|uniref:SH3 domain-containing protein n=1 Tax=Undibacterium sp. TJN19 TaxID=3413055 RepID=UPI003BF2CBDF